MPHLTDSQLIQNEQYGTLSINAHHIAEDCLELENYELAVVKKLKEQVCQLQESNKAKDKILTLVSHDIKGPLGSLHSLISMQDEELSEAEQKFVKQSIQDQVQNLGEIVDSLFRWASIAFKSDVRSELFDLNEVVSKCFLQLRSSAQAKYIEMNNQINVNPLCEGNADQIAFSIRNILANAIKFTPTKGSINVSCSIEEGWLTLHIRDNGIGMSEHQLARLFTPNQVSTYGTDGEKGTGFGLWLCHDYIKANNGTITVESKKDVGSTFSIKLPCPKTASTI